MGLDSSQGFAEDPQVWLRPETAARKRPQDKKAVQIFLRWSENAVIFSKVKVSCLSYIASS